MDKQTETPQLTTENADKVATIINNRNPEWGVWKLNYNEYCFDGMWNHSIDGDRGGRMIDEGEFKDWDIVSWK